MISGLMLSLLVVEALAWTWAAWAIAETANWSVWTVPMLAVVIYCALRLVLVLVSFGVARAFRGKPWPPLSVAGWVTCIAAEWGAVLRHHLVVLPFHRVLRRRRGGRHSSQQPVLLLHGLWNNAGVWRPLVRYLRSRGVRGLRSITYGPPWSSIETFAEQVAREVERICSETGQSEITIVGHSMGGLVARAYLRRYGAARVGRLITLGTPHRGSELARLAHGACGVELRPSSEWIAGWRSVPALPIPCVSIYSLHDNLVVPQSSPELPGATWVAIPGVGHNAMHYSRPFHEAVAQALGPR